MRTARANLEDCPRDPGNTRAILGTARAILRTARGILGTARDLGNARAIFLNRVNRGRYSYERKRVSPQEFDRIVAQACARIPARFRKRLKNIAILVEPEPTPAQLARGRVGRGGTLLGLYEGRPLTIVRCPTGGSSRRAARPRTTRGTT